jgi:hypothetical protein
MVPTCDKPHLLKEMPVRRTISSRYILPILSLLGVTSFATAQTPARPPAPKPPSDVLIFANGDQLTGKLERVAAGNIVFASDMAGELTIAVDKVKELRSGAQFALLRKGEKVGKGKLAAPEGTVAVVDGKVTVTPITDPAVTVPAAQVAYLVDQKTFDKELNHKVKWYEGWNGQVNGGATLVRSTTSATTLTAGLNLLRALPGVAWMEARNRTTVNVNETYGKNTSPGAIPQTVPPTPDVTTLSSIFHADAERDEYISPRFYVLADTSFDHNYAQGLQLQEVYGGGVGWTPIQTPKQQLDVKVDVHYETQRYIAGPVNGSAMTTTPATNLIGSTLFESYHRNLPRKLVFTEIATILPAFNNDNDYSANATATLAIPVFKRLSAMISTTDNFLNDPAFGYKKNSYQFVTGVTYLIR